MGRPLDLTDPCTVGSGRGCSRLGRVTPGGMGRGWLEGSGLQSICYAGERAEGGPTGKFPGLAGGVQTAHKDVSLLVGLVQAGGHHGPIWLGFQKANGRVGLGGNPPLEQDLGVGRNGDLSGEVYPAEQQPAMPVGADQLSWTYVEHRSAELQGALVGSQKRHP